MSHQTSHKSSKRARAAASDLTAPAPQTVGEWQFGELLAISRHATVHAARPKNSGDREHMYVVKTLRSDVADADSLATLLRREATVGCNVCHPHLVPVLDAGLIDPPYFIVMPRLHGQTLRRTMETSGPLPARAALWIARQTAEALAALHHEGWLHGDLKPSNVFVSLDGHATLLDLGFARRFEEFGSAADRLLLGTFNYIAPEMITSAVRADARSDLYSLGAMMYEMLSGELPFKADSLAALAEQHRQAKPVALAERNSDLPVVLCDLVDRTLAKEPLRRPQSAAEVVRSLITLEIETFSPAFGD